MPEQQIHSPFEVLRVFLKLGLTSFGGPVAHLGYFRQEFVARRGWLGEAALTDLVALGLIGIFLPGILILIGALPFWHALRSRDATQAAMRGVNAAVVGILGGALYNPVWITSVKTLGDLGVVLTGIAMAETRG
jgi:chromate transport protein ChrA